MSVFQDLYAYGNVVIGQDLTVKGTTTSINTDNMNVKDSSIVMNSGYGVYTVKHSGLLSVVKTFDEVIFKVTEIDSYSSTITVTNPEGTEVVDDKFLPGVIIQLVQPSDSTLINAKNNGLYLVSSTISGQVTLESVEPFTQVLQTETFDPATEFYKLQVVDVVYTQMDDQTNNMSVNRYVTSINIPGNYENTITTKTVAYDGGAPISQDSINLTGTSNQIVLGPTDRTQLVLNYAILTTDSAGTITVNFPKPTAEDNVVYTNLAQTVNDKIMHDTSFTGTVLAGSGVSYSFEGLPTSGLSYDTTNIVLRNGDNNVKLTTEAVILPSGIEETPGVLLSDNLQSGIYYESDNNLIGVSIGGNAELKISTSGVAFNNETYGCQSFSDPGNNTTVLRRVYINDGTNDSVTLSNGSPGNIHTIINRSSSACTINKHESDTIELTAPLPAYSGIGAPFKVTLMFDGVMWLIV
jgi:hypothetical protein